MLPKAYHCRCRPRWCHCPRGGEHVIARAARHIVIAAGIAQDVIAVIADQTILTLAALNDIVPLAALQVIVVISPVDPVISGAAENNILAVAAKNLIRETRPAQHVRTARTIDPCHLRSPCMTAKSRASCRCLQGKRRGRAVIPPLDGKYSGRKALAASGVQAKPAAACQGRPSANSSARWSISARSLAGIGLTGGQTAMIGKGREPKSGRTGTSSPVTSA